MCERAHDKPNHDATPGRPSTETLGLEFDRAESYEGRRLIEGSYGQPSGRLQVVGGREQCNGPNCARPMSSIRGWAVSSLAQVGTAKRHALAASWYPIAPSALGGMDTLAGCPLPSSVQLNWNVLFPLGFREATTSVARTGSDPLQMFPAPAAKDCRQDAVTPLQALVNQGF